MADRQLKWNTGNTRFQGDILGFMKIILYGRLECSLPHLYVLTSAREFVFFFFLIFFLNNAIFLPVNRMTQKYNLSHFGEILLMAAA